MSVKGIDNLYDESVDSDCEIRELLDALILAEWDSNTLKEKLVVKMRQWSQIFEEIQKTENEQGTV